MQTTLKTDVTFEGVGLHSGISTRMTLRAAEADHGVWFKRLDVAGSDQMVPALYDAVDPQPLRTRIVNAAGVEVMTIEHIMAALAGCGVHNVLVEIDGPEVPIMDGASAEFVRGILAAGLGYLDAALYAVEVLRPVSVAQGEARATLAPASALEIDFEIEFDDAAIGAQSKRLNMANGTFVRELSDSRTFCRKSDIDMMHANGMALGGTYDNAVVVDGDAVLSPGGLRHADEAVRHKMLDALGELSLAGAPILGRYHGVKAGHALTNQLLRALFADERNYRIVRCSPEQQSRLPGVGVKPADLALVA